MLKGTEMEVRNHFEEKHGMETFIIFIDSRMRIKMDHFHFHTSVREVNCIALACFETCKNPVAHGAML